MINEEFLTIATKERKIAWKHEKGVYTANLDGYRLTLTTVSYDYKTQTYCGTLAIELKSRLVVVEVSSNELYEVVLESISDAEDHFLKVFNKKLSLLVTYQ